MTVRDLDPRGFRQFQGKPAPALVAVLFQIDQQPRHVAMHQRSAEFHGESLRQIQRTGLPALRGCHHVLRAAENFPIGLRHRAGRVFTTEKKGCHSMGDPSNGGKLPDFSNQRNPPSANRRLALRFHRFFRPPKATTECTMKPNTMPAARTTQNPLAWVMLSGGFMPNTATSVASGKKNAARRLRRRAS